MSKKEMTLGKNVCAYTVIELPDDTEMSVENLKRIAKERYDNGDDVFEADWSTGEGLRIVHVKNGDVQDLSDIPFEPQYHEAGQMFVRWLKGTENLKDTIEYCADPLFLDMSIEEIHEACFSIAGVSLRVSFACRKGASKEEKNLAMLVALENAGASVECVLIGEQPAKVKNGGAQ